MPDPPGAPRRLNLNLPSDYFSKPTTKLYDWLDNNTASLRILSEAQIIQKARAALGPDLQRLNDADLAAHIRAWAKSHNFMLAGGPGAAPVHAGDPEVVERLKKFFGSIPTEVKWVGDQGSAAINMSGLAATLDAGKVKYAISQGWDGTVQFKTQTSGMTFAASLGPKNWSLTFNIGRTAPNLSDLENVFKKGETALRGVVSNLDKVDFQDPGKTKQQFSPYLDPIKQAIDAASKAAALRPGSVSVGAWFQGGVPGAPEAGGVSGGIRLTIVF